MIGLIILIPQTIRLVKAVLPQGILVEGLHAEWDKELQGRLVEQQLHTQVTPDELDRTGVTLHDNVEETSVRKGATVFLCDTLAAEWVWASVV